MKYSDKNIARNIFALCRPTYDSPAERQEDDYHSELDNFVAIDGQLSKGELLAISEQK